MQLFNPRRIILSILGSLILAAGLFNVHSLSSVTEGGALGLSLFLYNLLSVSVPISSIIINIICYAIGWRTLGKDFLLYSFICASSFSIFYALFELIGPLFPQIAQHKILAAIVGAIFVGVGVGLCVKAGGAPTGDDALAMSLSRITRMNIRWIYLISDLLVLGLSLIYIPLSDILYSLLTVVLSGQIIGLIDGIGKGRKDKNDDPQSNQPKPTDNKS